MTTDDETPQSGGPAFDPEPTRPVPPPPDATPPPPPSEQPTAQYAEQPRYGTTTQVPPTQAPPPGGQSWSAPPPAPPAPRPTLRRVGGPDKMIGGVAGGIAAHFGLDPVLIRIGFAVLGLMAGAGIALYLVLWLLMAEPDGSPGPAQRILGRHGNLLLGVAVVVFALATFGWWVDGPFWNGPLGLAIALGVILWLLLSRPSDTASGSAAPPPVATGTGTGTGTDPAYPPARPGRSRPRAFLGPITLCVALIVVGAMALLDQANAIDPVIRLYVAIPLALIGAALVIGSLWGRARGLILLGIPLALVTSISAGIDGRLNGGYGEREYVPASIDEVGSVYELGAGAIRLDLTGVDFTDESVTSRIVVGGGEVTVWLPPNVDVDIDAQTGLGAIDLDLVSMDDPSYDQSFDPLTNGNGWDFELDSPADSSNANGVGGTNLHRTISDDGADGPGGGQLTLVIDVGVGQVEVNRA